LGREVGVGPIGQDTGVLLDFPTIKIQALFGGTEHLRVVFSQLDFIGSMSKDSGQGDGLPV
jgi:hypothetical protein